MLAFAFTFALLIPQAAAPAAAANPTPAPTARPAPALGRSSEPARPKTLSEHAALMKVNRTPTRQVSFDDVKTVDPANAAETSAFPTDSHSRATSTRAKGGKTAGGDAEATQAQRRMDKAVAKGLAVPERTRSSSRDRARLEWDEAADACRKTPGCNPQYRDDATYGENKPLKTDQELIQDVRKRGFSEPHPLPK
ncbi:MAG TPA: hypothetical protein VE129_05050 [Thermoanaerobaculia bacterium]|nr:hypothetical protein [Thermoanaerobaculia bacterium]